MILQNGKKLSVLVEHFVVTHIELDCPMCLDRLNPWSKKQGKLLDVADCFWAIEFAKKSQVQFCQPYSCWYHSKSGAKKRAKTPWSILRSACWWNYVLVWMQNLRCITKCTFPCLGQSNDLHFRLPTYTGSYWGCAWCMYKGRYSKHLQKVVYPGNRQCLPVGHVLRDDCNCQNFSKRSAERRGRPEIQTFYQDVMFHEAYGNARNDAQGTMFNLPDYT